MGVFENRDRLPTRRACEQIEFEWIWNGTYSEWVISMGKFEDGPQAGQPSEVFVSKAPKIGSELESLIQDACVLISHLLQRGMSINDLSRAVTREGIAPDAPAGSVIGLIIMKLGE